MGSRIVAAAIAIELSALVGSLDGLYFHLYKYKLYAHPASVTEHRAHTLRAIFFGPIVFLLFAWNFAGLALWALVAVLLADFGVQSWDVLIERDSRAELGGLTPVEYWIHVFAVTTHVAGVTLVLSAKPASAWSLSAPLVTGGAWPLVARATAMLLVPGALGIAALHLWLLQPRYRDTAAAAVAATGDSSGD